MQKSRVVTVNPKLVPYQWTAITAHLPLATPSNAKFLAGLLHTGDPEQCMTLHNIYWKCEVRGLEISGIIPMNMVTDIATIPRSFFWWSERDGAHTIAALAHDDLYATERFSRLLCDEIFYQLLLQFGVSLGRAEAMYAAVRLFGAGMWSRHTVDTIESSRYLHQYSGSPFGFVDAHD